MSSIPIHPPSFQSHSQQSNNHQFNTSYTQINHNHNNNQHHVHNHHHVHYNNQKIPPTAVPIIIKSKAPTAMTQPFNCNKNNIPPLKTHRNHPPPPSIHPHARNNSHRHHRPHPHPRHHTPHPRHMHRSRNQTYSNFTPQQQRGYGHRVQRQSNNYYTHRQQVSNPPLPPQPQRADSTLAPSSPTNIHFKASSPTNFIQSQPPPPSTTPTMGNDHPFGNVITDGAVKAPSPIGLDTLDTNSSPHNISPHNMSPHVQHAQSTQVRHALMPRTRPHAKSHASVNQYAYVQQHRHNQQQQQLHHQGRKRKHSQCTKLNQHICAPYNNHHHHSTHCQSHSHNHASAHNYINKQLLMQPAFKKRKIANNNNKNAANTPNQAFMSHPLHQSCHSHKSRHDHSMAPLGKHMHAPHCVRVHRQRNKAAVRPPSAPFTNTNISPPKPPTPKHSKSKKQLKSHTRNTYKPHSKQFMRPFPALTEQRYTVDDGTESTNTHISTHSLPNFKFTTRTHMASHSNPKARAAASTHPLSAGQIVPALMSMPMPSITDSHRNRSQMLLNNSGDSDTALSNTSITTHTQYPLYPQGPMMVPTRTNSVNVSSHMLTSPNTFNTMRSNISPNTSPACITPYMYDNEYTRDVKANVSEIPQCRNSPFIISDGTNYSENAHDKLTHFHATPNNDDISEQSVDEAANSVDVFDDMDGYHAYNENRRKLCHKLGIEDMADFDGNLPPFPITFAELNCHHDGNHNINNNISFNELSHDQELKKAALFALYDVDDLELRQPEVTTLRLSPNEDIMSLCSGSLMGGSHNKSCQRPQKSYVTVNDYNLTYSMAKRGANHEMYKIKMPLVCQQLLQEKLAAEYQNMDKLEAYKIPHIAPDALSAAIKRKQPETAAIDGGDDDDHDDDEDASMVSTDSDQDGIVTDLNEILSLGVAIPSYCLNPNDYTRKQLRDPGCFKETQFVANPNGKSRHRRLEIHFFIYVPGADIGGEIKTKCNTYSPVIYEITSDGKRRCALCGTANCDCTGIIDLLRDDNERIWACNKCKHTFRVGLKKNRRLKQYRVKDVGCSDDDGGDADYDVLQEMNKAQKKKVKKKKVSAELKKEKENVEKKKNRPFCEANVAFSPYVYRPRGAAKGVYIMRRFERRDLDILHDLDIKMTAQLLGDEAECYGKGWLHKLTNPARTTHHIWRTIACCELLAVGELDEEEKCHEIVGADGECERKVESLPVAFAMYKHIKNENISKRYGELFWILVDDKHQRKGIASRLIDIMVNEAGREENISQFRLHVLKENYAAIELYKRLAFYKKGVKPNYPKRNFESYRCVKML